MRAERVARASASRASSDTFETRARRDRFSRALEHARRGLTPGEALELAAAAPPPWLPTPPEWPGIVASDVSGRSLPRHRVPSATDAGARPVEAIFASATVGGGGRVDVAVLALPSGLAVSLITAGTQSRALARAVPALARRLAAKGLRMTSCTVRQCDACPSVAGPRGSAR